MSDELSPPSEILNETAVAEGVPLPTPEPVPSSAAEPEKSAAEALVVETPIGETASKEAVTASNLLGKKLQTDDRRIAPRKIYVTRILVLQVSGRLFEGKTIDISESGLSLIAPFNLVENEMCRMRFEIPAGSARELFELDAKIVYSVYQSTKGFKVGMQFNRISDMQKAQIRQFVAAIH